MESERYKPEIYLEHISSDMITIMLKSGSVCELDSAEYIIGNSFLDLNPVVQEPVFWFSRIKAKIEGRGDGTFLMKRLTKILDKNTITVINQPNPYGQLNLEQLISFYMKYGFVDFGGNIMIRFPNKKSF